MLGRLWWFGTGIILGIYITIKSLGRRPTAADWGRAAARTGSVILHLAAKGVRPPSTQKSVQVKNDQVKKEQTIFQLLKDSVTILADRIQTR